MENNAEIPFG